MAIALKFRQFSIVLALACAMTAGCSRDIPLESRPLPAQAPVERGVVAPKLPFDGAHNFRDLGGLTTADGKRIRPGMIYRADALSDLSSTDEHYLERLDIRRIVDFRSEGERESAPNRIAPDSSIRIVNKPIPVDAAAVEDIKDKVLASDTSVADMQALLIDANRQMVEDFTPVYREYMQELLDAGSYPTVFHCSAGKDRTGLAAALLLEALGVPRDQILDDYLASNRHTASQVERMLWLIKAGSLFRANTEAVRALFAVDQRYIAEAYAAMEEGYGSVDNYLEQGLGIGAAERERLASLLLY